ncbi:MAG: site-2 protease family protein [Desulfobacterales bacterium]|nr:site-2 protease family protein [Desulfobacterales bacterium]
MFQGFDLNKLVVMIAPLLFAVTIHEAAHGWVAYRLGDPTAKWYGRLTLNPIKHLDLMGSLLLPLMLKLIGSPIIFGYAKPVPVNFSNLRNYRRDTILVASAGVAANLGCALVCGMIFQILLHFRSFWIEGILRHIVLDLFYMLGYSVLINSILAIFNLIPLPPLDGSRILSMLLPPQYSAQFASIERFGMIILIFLLLTGVLNSILSFFIIPLLRISLGSVGLSIFLQYAMQ